MACHYSCRRHRHYRPTAVVSFLAFVLLLTHAAVALSRSATPDLPTRTENRPSTAATAADGDAPRLHFGVVSVPLWGHFKPLWAVAEELAHRGHTVTLFVEEPSWCPVLLQHSRHRAPLVAANLSTDAYAHHEAAAGTLDIYCLLLPRHAEVFSAATFQPMTREGSSVALSFVRLFDDLFRHHELSLGDYIAAAQAVHARHHPLTTLLCDIVTYACTSAARKLHVPVVHTFPFTTQLSVGLHPLLPAVGLGLPRHMTLVQRTKNFAFKFVSLLMAKSIVRSLNRVRADHGVAPLRDAYELAGMYAPLITSTLWGLDIPQPLCPNVHPVGPLNTRDQRVPFNRQDLSTDLAHFLDRCTQGVVYVNWGTLAAPSAAMENTLFEGLAAAAPYCVVWKRRTALTATRTVPSPDRFFVTTWLNSPMAVLKHPHTLAFVSHCGDTSLHEAVEAAVPIIGVPLFADQADVCQRVVESGIGVQVTQTKIFRAEDVEQAVADVAASREAMAHRLRDLRAIAASYGGPSRAADIVETRQYNLLLNRSAQLEQCSHLGGALRLENILLVWGTSVFCVAILWTCLLRSVGRRVRHLAGRIAQVAKALWRAPRSHHAQPTGPLRQRVRAVPRTYKGVKEL